MTTVTSLGTELACTTVWGILSAGESEGYATVLARFRLNRIVEMCQATAATRYVVGPAAVDYISDEPFRRAGIALEFMDYSGYSAYEQVHPPFIHDVSIVDLILNTGPEARTYLKAPGRRTVPSADSS